MLEPVSRTAQPSRWIQTVDLSVSRLPAVSNHAPSCKQDCNCHNLDVAGPQSTSRHPTNVSASSVAGLDFQLSLVAGC